MNLEEYDAQNDLNMSSLEMDKSIASNIYGSYVEPNIIRLRQRAATLGTPAELIFDFPSANENNPESILGSPGLNQRKRRSKRDLAGRTFDCRLCNKSYLSYPALYTHAKTKHSSNPMPTKNIRGRPRKSNESSTLKKATNNFGTPENKDIDVFKILSKEIANFDEDFNWGLKNPKEHPLMKELERTDSDDTCDYILGKYCQTIAKSCDKTYFEKVCRVILLYRECLNKYGWEKLFEEDCKDEESKLFKKNLPVIEVCMEHSTQQQIKMKEDYSVVNNADRLPEVANEFILIFIKDHDLGISQDEIISIIMNMCDWLYTNGYTKTQMLLIS